MRKVALFKLVGRYHDYDDLEQCLIPLTDSYEEISDEEYQILYKALSQYPNQSYNDQYLMIEQKSVSKAKEDLKSVIEKLKQEAEKQVQYQIKYKQRQEELKKKRAANAIENKRKKLERLKKELGEV